MKPTTTSHIIQYAALLLSVNPLGTLAICNDGEVGIGTNQLCQLGTPYTGPSCSGAQGVIYSNNCNFIATGSECGFCSGGWPKGYDVQCSGGKPTYVVTTWGNFGNCYQLTSGDCSKGPTQYNFVDFCCSRV